MKPVSQHFALIVDSDEHVRDALADVLVSRGYVVHVAPSAEAAAALSLQVGFSVIVVGASQLSQPAPAVRALLRQEGIRQAVVFHDARLGSNVDGIAPACLAEIRPGDDQAARLRLLVPLAEATAAVKRKRKTDKN